MEISERAKNTQSSPIRKLYPYAEKAEQNGKTVLYVNIGQPDIATPPEAMGMLKNFDKEVLAYSPSTGYYSLRNKISNYFGKYRIDINAEEIAVTTGGSEAVLFSLAAVCDPGDNILVAEPFYANYKSIAQMLGIDIKSITTRIEDGFHFTSKSQIEEKIDERTRAILICNPSNPTGTVYSHNEIEWIVELAKEKDLFIISDEVYREFRYTERDFVSPLHYREVEDRVIVTDSISKRFSSCGARIGFLISKNSDVIEAITKFAMARLSPPSLEQFLAETEFGLSDEYFKDIVNEYRLRKNAFIEELSGTDGVVFPDPEGAFYIIVKFTGVESEDFAKFLLQDFSINDVTVMVAPAKGFYNSKGLGEDEVRVAFVLTSSKMKLAAKILREGYFAYRKMM